METDTVAASADARSPVRSCVTCSKAKAKCVRQAGQHVCERCCRLGKECSSREPVLRKRKTTKATRSAQLEKLENKIEHLVSALSASQALGGQVSPPSSSIDRPDDRREPESAALLSLCFKRPNESQRQPLVVGTPPPTYVTPVETPTSTTDHAANVQLLGISMTEAEILLDRFQRLMASAFPFVLIPREMTARQLHEQKPLLLRAVLTVTYFHDLPTQQTMVKALMRDIAERVLVESEKSIGVLQGILVFVAWYHPHVFWGQQVTNLLHLATAMIIDMGIDRLASPCHIDLKSAHSHKSITGLGHMSAVARIPTLEEQRALAGVYYLTSMMASCFKKSDSLAYTKYLDDRLNNLAETREHDSDLLLVQMVRLQHLAQETHAAETSSVPTQMYTKALEADLVKLRQSNPCREDSTFLKLQCLTAEIHIWELSLHAAMENGQSEPLRSHLDGLYRCLQSVKAFLDIYFSIPTSTYLTLPFSVYGQFGHAFVTLCKLASLDCPGWDMQHDTPGLLLDFSRVVDEVSTRFDDSSTLAPDGLQVNNDGLRKWGQRVRHVRQVVAAKFCAPEGQTDLARGGQFASAPSQQLSGEYNEATTAVGGAQQATPPDDVLAGDFFNYLDEGFWNSLAGDLDLGFPEPMMA